MFEEAKSKLLLAVEKLERLSNNHEYTIAEMLEIRSIIMTAVKDDIDPYAIPSVRQERRY